MSKLLLSVNLNVILLFMFAGFCAGSDLIGYWNFDENSGNVASDTSGNGNNGQLTSAIWAEGKMGSGLDFNGASSYVEVPKSPALDSITSAITIKAWVKTPLTTRGTVVARWFYGTTPQRAYVLLVELDGTVSFGLNSDGTPVNSVFLNSIGKIMPNVWTNIAATSDGTTMKIYINGMADSKTAVSPAGGIQISTANVHIGAWQWTENGRDAFFIGTIDEVKISSRAFSSSEIQTEYLSDITYPDITITSPKNNQLFSFPDVTVNGTASDSIGLSKTEIKLNSSPYIPAEGTGSWSQKLTLSPGINTIYARATNTWRNTRETSITVIYFSSKIRVHPEVFSPNGDNRNDYVEFQFESTLGENIGGKIFDLEGALVAELKSGSSYNSLVWDGRMSNGSIAPPGIYLYQVESGGKTTKGTVLLAK